MKTPLNELFLNHRGTEDTEKNRKGILQHDKDCVMRVGEHISGSGRMVAMNVVGNFLYSPTANSES